MELKYTTHGSLRSWSACSKILAGDDAPGFFVKHFIKDMGLAVQEAADSGLTLEILADTLAHYEALAEKGQGDLGTQALIHYYE